MKRMYRHVVMATTALALASCGSSGEKQEAAGGAPAGEAAAPAAPAPAATPAAAAAPAADNTDTVDGVKLASLTPDAAHGKQIFVQCKACHSYEPGKNMVGPSLAGIVGRKAGIEAGYSYSPANKNSGITWSPEKLFQYLEKPQRVVPGTKMAFAGLPKAQDRADIIEYLKAPN